MADTDVFLSLAEIAGVFVGFGALIAVRSGGASDAFEVGYTRGVVWMGLLTVVAAIAPVTVARFALPEHQVWALSSVLVLVGWAGFAAVNARTAEYRANWAAEWGATRSRWSWLVNGAAFVLYGVVMTIAPIVIGLGLAPDLEAALYFAVVVLILLGAAWSLLTLVYAQRRPATG